MGQAHRGGRLVEVLGGSSDQVWLVKCFSQDVRSAALAAFPRSQQLRVLGYGSASLKRSWRFWAVPGAYLCHAGSGLHAEVPLDIQLHGRPKLIADHVIFNRNKSHNRGRFDRVHTLVGPLIEQDKHTKQKTRARRSINESRYSLG